MDALLLPTRPPPSILGTIRHDYALGIVGDRHPRPDRAVLARQARRHGRRGIDVKYCRSCGTGLRDNAQGFCPTCGVPLAEQAVASSPTGAAPAPMSSSSQPPLPQSGDLGQRPPQKNGVGRWVLWSALGLLVLAGIGLGVYFGVRGDDARTVTQITQAVQTTGESSGGDGSSSGQTISTALDLGRAEMVDPDLSTAVESDLYGWAAANNVLVVMEEGQSRAQAEEVAAQINGTIVGEIEFMDLYQIETSGSTVQELETAIERAEALPGVEYAMPNGLVAGRATIVGKICSPMRDPVYQADDAFKPYQMIGMMEAWQILRASRVLLNPTHVGVVDSAVYTQSGNGFAPELYFPDASGTCPEDEVCVRGLDAKDITDQPRANSTHGLSHGTMVTHVIAADWNEGVTGVAAGLYDKLTVTVGNWESAASRLPDGLSPETLSRFDPFAVGYFGRQFVEMLKQVEDGAEVINLSYGPDGEPDPRYNTRSRVYKEFFRRMHSFHPRVLFVAAAGDENGGLDGSNFGPGGIKAPNLITVGSLDRTGDRSDVVDMYGEETVQEWYEQTKAAGDIEADASLDYFIDKVALGSNYAVGDGEVTLSACGIRVVVGRDAQGKPVLTGGTSLTAPQVTAAAAMMKSIDPSLDAEQIKQILVRTAATEVTVGGARVKVPANVGGRVLRVDRAVLEVINRMRPSNDQLIRGDLIELTEVGLTAEKTDIGYMVTASVSRVEPTGVDLMIILEGDGEILGERTQHRSTLGDVSWTVVPGDDPLTVRVVRLDSGGCAFLELPGGWSPAVSPTDGETPSGDEEIEGPRWVLDKAVINPQKLPLEYHGGGSNPAFFVEERFKDLFVIYDVSATSFTVRDHWQDREYVAWDITMTSDFDAPKTVLVPGKPYELTVDFSHGGMVNDLPLGESFSYYSPWASIAPKESLVYSPWLDPGGVSSKTWTLTVPEPRAGDTLEIQAAMSAGPQCTVIWTYRAEE